MLACSRAIDGRVEMAGQAGGIWAALGLRVVAGWMLPSWFVLRSGSIWKKERPTLELYCTYPGPRE